MQKIRLFKLSATCAFALASSVAMAHLNIAQEDAISVGEGSREYKEGGGAFLDVNIAHDCSNEAGEHFPTTGVTIVMPNGSSVPGAYTTDRSGNTYGGNAIMGIKQRVNHTFRKNIVVKGPVDAFYSHGERTEDVRALKWLRGSVDNDHYDNLELKVSFPKIDPQSCIAKIKMFFPSMQYCKGGYKIGWIKTAESKYGTGNAKTRITDTYAAYATVVRTSDLPDSCGGQGETVEVMPSVEDINKYLGRNHRRKHMGHMYR